MQSQALDAKMRIAVSQEATDQVPPPRLGYRGLASRQTQRIRDRKFASPTVLVGILALFLAFRLEAIAMRLEFWR